MTFNILDNVTIIDGQDFEDRRKRADKLFGLGVISENQVNSELPIVVIEPAVAFEAVAGRIRQWLADDKIDAHEIEDIQFSEDYIRLQNPHIVDDPELLRQYRNNIVTTYRNRFRQVNKKAWDYLGVAPRDLPDGENGLIREERRKALKLLKNILERMITKQLGPSNNRFLIRGEADAAYHE